MSFPTPPLDAYFQSLYDSAFVAAQTLPNKKALEDIKICYASIVSLRITAIDVHGDVLQFYCYDNKVQSISFQSFKMDYLRKYPFNDDFIDIDYSETEMDGGVMNVYGRKKFNADKLVKRLNKDPYFLRSYIDERPELLYSILRSGIEDGN